MSDFLLGTGIVWILSALIVNPIAKTLTKIRNKEMVPSTIQTPDELKPEPEIDTGYYIATDVIVLGIAGFLLGLLLGWFFIGISFKAKGWPGLIAFITGSFLGSALNG